MIACDAGWVVCTSAISGGLNLILELETALHRRYFSGTAQYLLDTQVVLEHRGLTEKMPIFLHASVAAPSVC